MAIKDVNELHPEFRMVLEWALQNANTWGLSQMPEVRFEIIETYRPQARQDELYAQGRTKPGSRVTNAKHSKHTSRIAADVAPLIDGRIMWKRKDLFDKWGEFAEAQGLVWGGRFSWGYDGAHVEMPC